MLKKLLKYDLKYIYKNLRVFYSLAIFFAIVTRIFLSIDNSSIATILGQISSGVTIAMFFNIVINNIMRTWVNFKTHIYGDESYLLHTLPVTKKQIYLSKMLSVLIAVLTSTLVLILSFFIAYYNKENIQMIKDTLTSLSYIYDSTVFKLIITAFLIFYLELVTIIISGYTGLILGHRKNNNKIVFSIIYGFAFYIISQLLLLLIIYIIALFNPDIMNLFVTNTNPSVKSLKLIMYLAIAIYTIYNVIYYILNVKLLSEGVNVD